MKEVLTVEMQIAARARKYPGEALTNLHEFINVEMLNTCFDSLNKKGASGGDGEKWIDYNKQRQERIPQLLTAFNSGVYRASGPMTPLCLAPYPPFGLAQYRPHFLFQIE